MKSKTVASIMRHVASKLPSVHADTSVHPEGTTVELDEKEKKQWTRAKKDGQDDDVAEEVVVGGPNEEERLEKLYEQVAWPLGKKYGHPYDAFKLALTYAPSHHFVHRIHYVSSAKLKRHLHHWRPRFFLPLMRF
jgi:translation initiation factor 2 subunit 1